MDTADGLYQIYHSNDCGLIDLLLFPLLLLSHLIGDFPLQTDHMVERKRRPWAQSSMPVHIGIHLILGYLFSIPYCIMHHQFIPLVFISPIVAAMHLAIDTGKLALDAKTAAHGGIAQALDAMVDRGRANTAGAQSPQPGSATHALRWTRLLLFCTDQLLHVAVILGVVALFEPGTLTAAHAFFFAVMHGRALTLAPLARILSICIVLVYATAATSVVVQMLTDPAPNSNEYLIDMRRTLTENLQSGAPMPQQQTTETSFAVESALPIPRGRLIGYLERLIVIFVVCIGAYTVIPLIVAAKSLARFKKFDNQEWAEYFLVGTLSSILCATLCGLALRVLLGIHA